MRPKDGQATKRNRFLTKGKFVGTLNKDLVAYTKLMKDKSTRIDKIASGNTKEKQRKKILRGRLGDWQGGHGLEVQKSWMMAFLS